MKSIKSTIGMLKNMSVEQEEILFNNLMLYISGFTFVMFIGMTLAYYLVAVLRSVL